MKDGIVENSTLTVSQRKKAQNAAIKCASRGLRCKSIEELMKNGYTQEQAEFYRATYKRLEKSPAEKLIQQAACNGYQAGRLSYTRKTFEELTDENGYTHEQAKAYYDAYDKAAGTPEEQKVRSAKRAGRDAGRRARKCKTEKELKEEKGYTSDQAKTYINSYKLGKKRLRQQDVDDSIVQETSPQKRRRIEQPLENENVWDQMAIIDSEILEFLNDNHDTAQDGDFFTPVNDNLHQYRSYRP